MYSKNTKIKHNNQIPCQHGQPTVPTMVKPETNKTVQRIKLPKNPKNVLIYFFFCEGLCIKQAAQILTHKKIFAKLTTIHVPCQPFIFLFQNSATYSILPVLLPVFPATALHRHPSGNPPEKRCPHSPAPGQKEPSQMPSQRPRRSRQTAATPKWNEAICGGLGVGSDPAGKRGIKIRRCKHGNTCSFKSCKVLQTILVVDLCTSESSKYGPGDSKKNVLCCLGVHLAMNSHDNS